MVTRKSTAKQALLLDIQRLSTEDGPGLRTTVFFKGCNLKCAWCHNPESLSPEKEIEWHKERCLGCNLCAAACGLGGLRLEPEGMRQDRGRCVACEACVNACPAGAMEVKGRFWDLDGLLAELLKDRAYFGKEGGITLSGGEALIQRGFACELLRRLGREGIHTAVDTAGALPWSTFEKALPYTDLFLFDLKLMDARAHRRFTGIGNERILDNLKRLAARIAANGRPALWIRTPVIPGATDTHENIAMIGSFLHEHLSGAMDRWELCAFNNLCRDKYARLGLAWAYSEAELMPRARMEALHQTAQKTMRGDPALVLWSGSARME